MTDTPRTDAVAWHEKGIIPQRVEADFARQLERELTAAKGEVERLRAELDRRTTLNPAKEMLGWTPKEPK